MLDKINKAVDRLINSAAPQLDEIVDELKVLKKDGVTKNMIIKCLNSASESSLSESQSDRILEVLDIVHGFCQERYRVW